MSSATSGPAKAQEVHKLIETLDSSSSRGEHEVDLERLKVLGRDPKNADELFTRRGISVLVKHGLDESAAAGPAREALSCLANCMLLQPSTRELALEQQVDTKVAGRYKHAKQLMDEFLNARILLVLVSATSCDVANLIKVHALCRSILKCIERHAEDTSALTAAAAAPTPNPAANPTMALSETFKVLFAVAKLHAETADFRNVIKPAVMILDALNYSTATAQLIQHIIEALHILPVDDESYQSWFPTDNQEAHVKNLIRLLDQTTTSVKDAEADLRLSASIVLLLKLYNQAPKGIKSLMREKLLPSEAERDKPLGKSNTLPSRLLRLSTSGYTPQLRELIPELFFELSDRNAETFVSNVGYGYASGLLQNRKIPFTVPQGQAQSGESSMRSDVNPVTGQFFDREEKSQLPEMTDEEKEREAERLFVLFERLKATGVMDVKNPVEEAVESGRFEELPDD